MSVASTSPRSSTSTAGIAPASGKPTQPAASAADTAPALSVGQPSAIEKGPLEQLGTAADGVMKEFGETWTKAGTQRLA